jgi:hypothetical protein
MVTPAHAHRLAKAPTESARGDPTPEILALAWRPAWSMRRRVGCLAPVIAAVRTWLGREPKDAARTSARSSGARSV